MALRLQTPGSMKRILALVFLAGASACGGNPPVAPAPALLSTAESSYLFDTLTTPVTTHDFVITNSGGTASAEVATQLTGDVAQFTIQSDQCGKRHLGAGQSCIVTIALAGEISDRYEAQLHVNAGADYVDVELAGRVGPCQLAAKAASPTPHVLPGATASTQVTVTNSGAATTGILTVSRDPTHPILSDGCSGTQLIAGDSCAFTVSDTASLTAAGSDSFEVAVVESLGSSITVAVTFVVDPPVVTTLQIEDGDFGVQDPSAANPKQLYVHNSTAFPSGKLSLTLSGGGGGSGSAPPGYPFTHAPATALACDGTILAPGSSCIFWLTIDPGTPVSGTYTATATVNQVGGASTSAPLKVQTASAHTNIDLEMTGTGQGDIVAPWGVYACAGAPGSSCGGAAVAVGYPTTFSAAWDPTSSVFTRWATGPCAGSTVATCTWIPASSAAPGFAMTAQFDKK